MSAEENKALIRRYFAVLNAGDFETFSGLLAPDFSLHFDGMPVLDGAGAIGLIQEYLTALPGIHHEILDQLAEGDRVATRIHARGTQRGELMGIPPTGREISISSTYIHRVVDGRISELWVNADSLGMLQQLGVVPVPGATPAEARAA